MRTRYFFGTMTMIAMLTALLLAGAGSPALAVVCEDCEGGDGGGGGGSPLQPPPPQIAAQLNLGACLEDLGIDPQDVIAEARSAVYGAFAKMRARMPGFYHASLYPNPDVRVACVATVNGPLTNITAWFRQPGTLYPNESAMRQAMTQDLMIYRHNGTPGIPGSSENFAVQVHKGAIATFVHVAFLYANEQVQKEVVGTPLEGEVTLWKTTITYDDVLKQITTRIDGRVNGQLTGEFTPFWTIMKDTLYLSPIYESVSCTGTAVFGYGSSVDTVVLSIFLAVLDPIADALNNGQDLDIDAMVSGKVEKYKGPGCYITPMFPAQRLVPDTTLKLVFDYKRLTVSEGVTVGGAMTLQPRQPKVTIYPADTIWAEDNVAPSAIYRFTATDMEGPYTVTWEAPGAIIANPHSTSTRITWNLDVDPGEQFSRTVKVTVTDGVGSTASHQRIISIKSEADKPDPLDPLPCYSKPWLCDPDF